MSAATTNLVALLLAAVNAVSSLLTLALVDDYELVRTLSINAASAVAPGAR
jgi:hypothetical protein